MSQARSSLLRLREGDVVRFCGLEAAARGLELASRRAVANGRRIEFRLEAVVTDESPCAVSVELPADGAAQLLHWTCSRDSPARPGVVGEMDGAGPGCAHVAAVVTAWIRAPADFVTPTEVASDLPRVPNHIPPSPSRIEQPPLLASAPLRRARGPASLADELTRLPSGEVIAVARRVLGVATNEHEARRLLVGTLRDPRQVSSLLERLDAGANSLFADIELLGASATAADLDALADRSGRSRSGLRTDLAVLERHGLVFRVPGSGNGAAPGPAGAEHSWRQFAGWRIPPEIRAAFTPRLPLMPLATVGPSGPPLLATASDSATPARPRPLRVQRGSPRPLWLALALLARAPRPYAPSLPSSSPHDRSSSSPATSPTSHAAYGKRQPFALLAGELAPSALAEFARSAGVSVGVARLARRLLLWAREAPDVAALRDLASVPPAERALALLAGFRLWRSIEAPTELADLNSPESTIAVRFDLSHEALRPAALAAEAASARGAILHLLDRVEPRTWYAIDDFTRLVWRVAPLFLRCRQVTYASPAWWLERRADNRPLRPTELSEWMAGEGAYLRLLLANTLVAWGAVDIAVDADTVPVAFRVTPVGRDLLSGARSANSSANAEPDDLGPPILLTRANALAVQPLAAGSALLDQFSQWARVTEIAGGRLVYVLDADRASAAFDRAASPEPLLASLRSLPHADRAVAATRDRLTAWQSRYGLSRIEAGWALVEALDAATLAEALAEAPEVAAVARPLETTGACMVIVPQASVPALRAALAKRGLA